MEVQMWNNKVLLAFQNKFIGNYIGKPDIQREILIKGFPYLLTEDRYKKYIIPMEYESKLPLRILETKELHYKSYVYWVASKVQPVRIKPEKTMEFADLVDMFFGVGHENLTDWTIYKLLVLTGYFNKIFMRISAQRGFGKTSAIRILESLTKNTAAFVPKSLPAMLYRSEIDLLGLDELGGLKSDKRYEIQEFLLSAAAGDLTYNKSTLGSTQYGSKNVYDISRLSIFALYNWLEEYTADRKQGDFFDNAFNKPVLDRLFPVRLSGRLETGAFLGLDSPEEVLETEQQVEPDLIEFTKNLEYYKLNWYKELKQVGKINLEYTTKFKFRRDVTTFSAIAKIFNLYVEGDKDDFQNLLAEFWNRHVEYFKHLPTLNPDNPFDKYSEPEKGFSVL